MSNQALSICHAALVGHGSLLATLFVGGLAGGATHCAGMCGPFVLSQTAVLLDAKPLRQVSELSRLRGAALLPYHAGRMTTYAGLGAAAALFSAQFRALPWFGDLSAALLAAAGLLFLLSAFPALRAGFPSLSGVLPDSLFAPLRHLFAHPDGWRGYVLGGALGFLPCGLVYAAILSASASGQPLTAALGMIVFALGTAPALVAVAIGGRFAFHRFRAAFGLVFPALMVVNSLALFIMAGEVAR